MKKSEFRGNMWQARGFKTYKEYLDSPEWQEKASIMKRAKHLTCQRCQEQFEDERGLVVHHTHYNSVCQEKSWDLEVLCHYCHKKEHGRKH